MMNTKANTKQPTEPRYCEQCGRRLTGRPEKRFCRDACRAKHTRERIKARLAELEDTVGK